MSEHAKHPSTQTYLMVFAALMVLTTITVAISYAGLSMKLSLFLAFSIATVKALLVASLFMHLRYEPRTILIFAVTPLVLAALFMFAIAPDVAVVAQ